ncbi:MAG: LLM class flavin-dependent oxidoreductase [Promethearchaeota archaeon]
MKYGLDVSTVGEYSEPRVLSELAYEAEQAGWDGFFIWDVLLYEKNVIDPLVALSAIIMSTKRMKVGIMVIPMPRRHPWKVAREIVSLDHLSNGRLIFGAGLGYNPKAFSSVGEETSFKIRAEKLDESLEILMGLWSGKKYSFHGKHYNIDNVKFTPVPVQSPRIPIWIAGFWPNRKPFQRAAKWDGVYPGKVNEEELTANDIKEICAYVKKHRKTGDSFDVAAGTKTPSDPDKRVEIIQSFVEAGITWWIEGIGDYKGSFSEMRKIIRSGPPQMNKHQ